MRPTVLYILAALFVSSLFLSCSDPKEAPTGIQKEVEVHGEGWLTESSPNFHGKVLAANQYDASECRKCHGNNFDGGVVEVSCRKCHSSYPHKTQWLQQASDDFHGKHLAANDYKTAECAACHGDDFTGGSSGISCRACHASFPHPEGWLEKASENFHGAHLAAKQYDTSECSACHGEDFNGGTSGVSCAACHAAFPHPTGWLDTASQDFHGDYLGDNQFDTEMCSRCHGEDFAGGTSGISCYTCHAEYPHLSGWVERGTDNFHGKVLADRQFDLSTCSTCHGTDFAGGDTGVACASCHAPFPHPSNWLNTNSDEFHGAYLGKNQYDTEECSRCHGEDFTGGDTGFSCFLCHTTFPHPQGWIETSSQDFHGFFLRDNQFDASGCTGCHGTDYTGGKVGVSCFTCHASYPHAAEWLSPASPDFHGTYLANNQFDIDACAKCHGADFEGGISGVSCHTCHAIFPHPADWLNTSSDQFHGAYLANKQFDTSECAQCHGADFAGGDVGVSCFTCHAPFPHTPGWIGTGEGSHSQFLRTTGFNLSACQSCHGQNYDVVKTALSCRTCHTQEQGPEACNTCHGNFAGDGGNLADVAPPAGVDGETDSQALPVGAHSAHLNYFSDIAATCTECHTVPAAAQAPGHLDGDGQADVPFNGPLAITVSEGGARVPAPVYDFNTGTCQNSYCHGNWALNKSQAKYQFIYVADKIEGNNATPVWDDPATAACGTCHGLPPTGHGDADITQCGGCHFHLDNEGNIIDKSKHINGMINALGQEYPMPSSSQ